MQSKLLMHVSTSSYDIIGALEQINFGKITHSVRVVKRVKQNNGLHTNFLTYEIHYGMLVKCSMCKSKTISQVSVAQIHIAIIEF